MKNKIEKIIIVAVVLLSVISVIMISSATVSSSQLAGLYLKQLVAVLLGLVIMWTVRNMSYEIFMELSPVLYFAAVVLLLAVLIFGKDVNGSRRWLVAGPINFQPSEFAKMVSILFGAYLIRKRSSGFKILLSFLFMAALVIIEPDAGTAMIFIPAYLGIMVASGRDVRWLFILTPFVAVTVVVLFTESYINMKGATLMEPLKLLIPGGVVLVIYFIMNEIKKINKNINLANIFIVIILFCTAWGAGIGGAHLLKDYQKKRIVSFMAPDLDPLGAGYNTRQSVLAVGSGRIAGKGIYEGTQTQLGFLPVRHTDFIFAVIAEETGFIGSAAVLFIIGLLLWQFIKVMSRTENNGARMIVSGIFMVILSQVIVNLGVTLGLLPVIGIQLPFISYGGSGVIVFMLLTGIILNINRQTEIIGI